VVSDVKHNVVQTSLHTLYTICTAVQAEVFDLLVARSIMHLGMRFDSPIRRICGNCGPMTIPSLRRIVFLYRRATNPCPIGTANRLAASKADFHAFVRLSLSRQRVAGAAGSDRRKIDLLTTQMKVPLRTCIQPGFPINSKCTDIFPYSGWPKWRLWTLDSDEPGKSHPYAMMLSMKSCQLPSIKRGQLGLLHGRRCSCHYQEDVKCDSSIEMSG
jgi:hypothetical protein